jgi:Ni/Co efflux regulator RcnB
MKHFAIFLLCFSMALPIMAQPRQDAPQQNRQASVEPLREQRRSELRQVLHGHAQTDEERTRRQLSAQERSEMRQQLRQHATHERGDAARAERARVRP